MPDSGEIPLPEADSLDEVMGSVEPRLWTPPLRELTPETSFGFEVIDFANDVLQYPLDEWQEWLIIHGGELRRDGLPRFRKIIVLVARQNGKTQLLVVLALYWLFKLAVPLILGTSTKTNYAKESWQKAVSLAESADALAHLRDGKWTFTGAGAEECFTTEGARYKIAAANANTGRSLTVHRLILDELRTHHHYQCWNAAVRAGNAVPDFQVWALSNAGDDRSVVLNDQRDIAVNFIETGEGSKNLGLFEWSAPPDADPLDVHALAQANPSLGRRILPEVLLEDARDAVQKGGEALTGFKTENMCIRVPMMDPAIDADAWKRCMVPGTLDDVKSRVALCVDVAPDGLHATLVAAARLDDERVRVEVYRSWEGYKCVDQMRRAMPTILKRIKPKTLGWLPRGPAAVLAADLQKKQPPPGVKIEEIRTDTAAACMGLAEQVKSERVVHSNDDLLNAHVTGAEKLRQGDTWVFSRKGDGHCDAAYALAGAVHLARTMRSAGKLRVITGDLVAQGE